MDPIRFFDSTFSFIAKVVSYQVQADLELLPQTALNENVRSYTPGLVGYNGSCDILYYKDDAQQISTKKILASLYKEDNSGVSEEDKVDLELSWIDGNDIKKITLTAYITNGGIGASVGEVTQASVSFTGSGHLISATI